MLALRLCAANDLPAYLGRGVFHLLCRVQLRHGLLFRRLRSNDYLLRSGHDLLRSLRLQHLRFFLRIDLRFVLRLIVRNMQHLQLSLVCHVPPGLHYGLLLARDGEVCS